MTRRYPSIKHKYIYLSKKYKRIYKIEVPLNLDITAKDLNESVESKVFIDNLMEIVPASVEIARRPFARFLSYVGYISITFASTGLVECGH